MQACKIFTGENMYLIGLEARNIILKGEIYILTFYGVRKFFRNAPINFLNICSTDPSVTLV
jgi:hypothetical protein